MPITESKTTVNEPDEPTGTSPETGSPTPNGSGLPDREPDQPVISTSRWVDYDTHELLEMISDLEDERRWARLREGVWIAVLVHLAILSALTWIPKYIFKVPLVVDRNNTLNKKDFTYLDSP